MRNIKLYWIQYKMLFQIGSALLNISEELARIRTVFD